MKPRRMLATLLVAGMLGVATLATCTSDSGSSTDGGGDANLAAGALAGQVESLTRALGAGNLDALPQALTGQQTGIWVSGRGEVTATPDLALLRLGVEARGDTVALARADAAGALSAMVDVLNTSGLQEKDIQTQFFNIRPEYTSVEVMSCVTEPVTPTVQPLLPPGPEVETREAAAPPPVGAIEPVIAIPEEADVASVEKCFPTRERVIVGYTVTNQITAKIRDLGRTGELIDSVAEAGGDLVRINGISFTVEEPAALQNEARELAIRDLLAKGQQIAEVAGIELGRLVSLTESGGGFPRAQTDFARAEFAMAAPAAPTPISEGELTVSVSVSGVFGIGNSVEE